MIKININKFKQKKLSLLIFEIIYLILTNFLILEGVKNWGNFYADVLNEPIQWEKGYIIPPTKPGLGVELNEDLIEKYSYEGKKLHLEMTEI